MTNIINDKLRIEMKEHFGRKRYAELRLEGIREWTEIGDKTIPARDYIDQNLCEHYVSETHLKKERAEELNRKYGITL